MKRTRRALAEAPSPHDLARRRALVMASGFAAVYAFVLLRAFQLQILQAPEMEEIARRQHERTISLRPQRGAILDRNDRPLAVSLDAESIYADPRKIEAAGIPHLARALGTPAADLAESLDTDRHFLWLRRGALPDVVEAVRALELRGIGFLPETRRYYPNRELAAAVLGFVGVDGNGLEGIERSRDARLSGSGIELVATRDALGRPLHPDGIQTDRLDRTGSTLVLTLDSSIQEIAESELAKAVLRYGALGGVVVVLDPATGDVLAMASAPGFNANAFGSTPPSRRRNRAITDVFEPGSTLKAVLAAAAIEAGVTEESREYDVSGGSWRMAGHTIHDVKAHERLDFADVIRLSSNIGAAQVALDLGPYRFGRTLSAFGFGERSGMGIGGESPGLVRDPRSWNRVELATIGFGQGIGSTPLQLASAFATIANDGIRMRPRIVREVRSRGGETLSIEAPEELSRPITPETARRVAAMLEAAAGPEGTGHAAVPDGIRVAGKTGTAQKARTDGRGYAPDRWVASFAGFAPVEAPRIAMVVIVDEPEGSAYGGVVAAPVFRAVLERSLPIIELRSRRASPDETDAPSTVVPAAFDEDPAFERLRREGRSTRTPSPLNADEVLASLQMPDFLGLTMRAAHREASAAAIELAPSGRGICIRQEPAAGSSLEGIDRVQVWFRAPVEGRPAFERLG